MITTLVRTEKPNNYDHRTKIFCEIIWQDDRSFWIIEQVSQTKQLLSKEYWKEPKPMDDVIEQ